jgi:hypothetical protein
MEHESQASAKRLTSDLKSLRFDKLDDLDRGLGDVSHVLAVRVLAKEARRANDDIAVPGLASHAMELGKLGVAAEAAG